MRAAKTGATAFVLARARPGDAIVLHPYATAFEYYRPRVAGRATAGGPATLVSSDPRGLNYRRIWLLIREYDTEAEAAVAATHTLRGEARFDDVRVRLYVARGSPGG